MKKAVTRYMIKPEEDVEKEKRMEEEERVMKERSKRIDVKTKAHYRSMYGVERQDRNFMNRYKETFDQMATMVECPKVFHFHSKGFLDKLDAYQREDGVSSTQA